MIIREFSDSFVPSRDLSACWGGHLQYPRPHGSQPGGGGQGGRQQRPWPRVHHLPGGCPQDDGRVALGHNFLLHVGGQYLVMFSQVSLKF